MKVLFLSSEVAPFSKTGGLADVAGALPAALAAEGHDVLVVTPLYRQVTDRGNAIEGGAFTLRFPFGEVPVALRDKRPGARHRVLLIEPRRSSTGPASTSMLRATSTPTMPSASVRSRWQRSRRRSDWDSIPRLCISMIGRPDWRHRRCRWGFAPDTAGSRAGGLHHSQPCLPGHVPQQAMEALGLPGQSSRPTGWSTTTGQLSQGRPPMLTR